MLCDKFLAHTHTHRHPKRERLAVSRQKPNSDHKIHKMLPGYKRERSKAE